MTENPTYLGDGVYASLENGTIRLHTSDGVRELQVIYLDDEVYAALIAWAAVIKVAP